MQHAGSAPPARRPTVRAQLRVLLGLLLGLSLAGTTMFAAEGSGADDRGVAVVAAARSHLGQSYLWGGTGPASWDCSGLTSVLWRTIGGATEIPRVADQQQAWAVPIPSEQVLPGDLVFFGAPVTHVGIVSILGAGADHPMTMLDASSSRGEVVERVVWDTGVIRFGRVRRPGMPDVRTWTPPPPPPLDVPVGVPRVGAPPAAVPPVDTSPAVVPNAAPVRPLPVVRRAGSLLPLIGLPIRQRGRSSAVAARAAHLASTVAGATTFTDVSLVRTAWRTAGGRPLPADRGRLVGLARRVALRDARVGDLVVYGAPAVHLGVYVGAGQMVDASRVFGRVVLRPVYTSQRVRLFRLPG